MLGHSEGASIAFMLAKDKSSAPDFIIGIGTPAVSGDTLLAFQSRIALKNSGLPDLYVDRYCSALLRIYPSLAEGMNSEEIDKIVSESYSGDSTSTDNALKMELKKLASAASKSPWMLNFIKYIPRTDISAANCRALAIYGTKDMQVPATLNAEPMRSALPEAEVQVFDNLNHMMQHAKTGDVSEYHQIEETISPEVLEAIVAFINRQ